MSDTTPIPNTRHHRIDYVELSVTDLDVAKQFYHDVFGWSFTDYGPAYSGIQGAEREAGGLALVETMPPSGGVLVILFSDDPESTAHAVTQAGGRITTPMFTFPGGRRFHFADPAGNELAVWTQE